MASIRLLHAPFFTLLPFWKIAGYPKLLVTLVTADPSQLFPEVPKSKQWQSW